MAGPEASVLMCAVCGEVCKRGVSTPCCTAQACRACAVKQATSTRKCWNSACGQSITAESLVNDDILRAAVAKYAAEGSLPKETVDQLKARIKEPEIAVVDTPPAAAKPAAAAAPGTPKGAQKAAAATPVKASPAGGAAGSPAAGAAAKRKPQEASPAAVDKKARRDPLELRVYIEPEIMHNNKGQFHLIQLACTDDTGNSFYQAIMPPFLRSILEPSTLQKFNLKRVSEPRNPPMDFVLPGRKNIPCLHPSPALKGFLAYINKLKTANPGKNIVLVAYRNQALRAVFETSKLNGIKKGLDNLLDGVASLEDYFRQCKPPVELRPINAVFNSSSARRESSDVLADMLKKLVARFETKNGNSVSTTVKKTFLSLGGGEGGSNLLGSSAEPGEVKYALENSINYPGLAWQSLTGPPPGSQPAPADKTPVRPAAAVNGKAPTKVPDAELEEIVILDEECEEASPCLLEVVHETAIFPVMTHPVLVRIPGLPPHTKFVTFKSVKYTCSRLDTVHKVYWKGKEAFTFFDIPNVRQSAASLLTCQANVPVQDRLSARRILGEALPELARKAPLDNRPFAKVVKVDLVLKSSTPFKMSGRAALPVQLMPHANAVTRGSPRDLVFRTTDVFLFIKSTISGLDVMTHLFSIGNNVSQMNTARVVFKLDPKAGSMVLRDGQVLGTAVFFQEENIPLLLLKADQHAKACDKNEMMTVSQAVKAPITTAKGQQQQQQKKAAVEPMEVEEEEEIIEIPATSLTSKQRRPCLSLAQTILYSGLQNPILVQLKEFEVTRLSKKFGTAQFEFTPEFIKLVALSSKDKAKLEKPFGAHVFWQKDKGGKEAPYAFLSVAVPETGRALASRELKAGLKVATYVPVQSEDKAVPALVMTVCADFGVKNVSISSDPVLVQVYLKFKDQEVAKEEVLHQVFSLKQSYNSRLEILNPVFRPRPATASRRLAPQKTQTNDMQAVLLLRAKTDQSVVVNAREVIADFWTVTAAAAAPGGLQTALKGFERCGLKVDQRMRVEDPFAAAGGGGAGDHRQQQQQQHQRMSGRQMMYEDEEEFIMRQELMRREQHMRTQFHRTSLGPETLPPPPHHQFTGPPPPLPRHFQQVDRRDPYEQEDMFLSGRPSRLSAGEEMRMREQALLRENILREEELLREEMMLRGESRRRAEEEERRRDVLSLAEALTKYVSGGGAGDARMTNDERRPSFGKPILGAAPPRAVPPPPIMPHSARWAATGGLPFAPPPASAAATVRELEDGRDCGSEMLLERARQKLFRR